VNKWVAKWAKMVDPTLPDQVQAQAAGGPSQEDRAGSVEPLQEASDPVRSEHYMSSPPKREDIDARLDRIALLLETFITQEKHEGPAKTSRIPKAPMFSDRKGSHEPKIPRDEGETKTKMSPEEAVLPWRFGDGILGTNKSLTPSTKMPVARMLRFRHFWKVKVIEVLSQADLRAYNALRRLS
jgi:hypothetical protein